VWSNSIVSILTTFPRGTELSMVHCNKVSKQKLICDALDVQRNASKIYVDY
jgi:hypothetical protein